MILDFNNSYDEKYNQYESILTTLTNKTFAMLKIKDNYIIELDFVDNKQIAELNKQYRNKPNPTDVLSFAFLELKEGETKIISNHPELLGVIIISIDKIISQAQEFDHTFKYELCYLYIHGLLHLLGYDHVHNEHEKKQMFELEDKILLGEDL